MTFIYVGGKSPKDSQILGQDTRKLADVVREGVREKTGVSTHPFPLNVLKYLPTYKQNILADFPVLSFLLLKVLTKMIKSHHV